MSEKVNSGLTCLLGVFDMFFLSGQGPWGETLGMRAGGKMGGLEKKAICREGPLAVREKEGTLKVGVVDFCVDPQRGG